LNDRKSDVLLINAGFGRRHFDKVVAKIPNLGLLFLAGLLEKNGISVEILDADARRMTIDEIIKYIQDLKVSPKYIGISATTITINPTIDMCSAIKKVLPDVVTILGGPHPSLMPDEVLKSEAVDYVIRGEGENTLFELITGQLIDTIEGLSFKKDGKIIHNSPRKLIKNLDEFPMPAYHMVKMEDYRPGVGNYLRLPFMAMITSKGCTGKCTFCATHLFGKRIRFISPERVVREIKFLVSKMGIKEILFYDDVFTVWKKRTLKLCKMIIDERLDITWSCLARADQVDREILELMKAAGCHSINFGVESGDAEILKNIKKEIDFDIIRNTVELCKEIGIHQRLCFMYGNPGETVETMEKTFQFAKELDPTHALFNITTPYPGSEMYDWADKNNYLLTKDWNKYSVSEPILKLPTVKIEEIEEYCFRSREYFLKRYQEKTGIRNE